MIQGPTPDDAELPAVRRWPLLSTWVVAAAVVVLLHQLAYLVAHPDPVARALAAGGHAYLEPLAGAGFVLGVALAGWVMACRATARLGYQTPSTGELASVIGVLFVGQETIERLVQGGTLDQVAAEPAVWIGLAGVPLLAVATRCVLLAGSRLRLPTCRTVPAVPPPVQGWSVLLGAPTALRIGVADSTRARGPPSSSD